MERFKNMNGKIINKWRFQWESTDLNNKKVTEIRDFNRKDIKKVEISIGKWSESRGVKRNVIRQ